MVQFIAEQNVLLYACAAVGLLGVISQVVLFSLYERLLRDMENHAAPKGKFMKQLRQKFSGYQRMNEGMSNVSVFVKKSLMEYRCLGMNLHQWKRMGGTAFVLCIALGIGGYYLTGMQQYTDAIRQNYLWAAAASALLLAGVYGITDVGYKQRYLQTGLENLLCNTGVPRSQQVQSVVQEKVPAQEHYRSQESKEEVKPKGVIPREEEVPETPGPLLVSGKTGSLSRRKRAKMAETQAQKDKRELKENLAKLKEGISETAASGDREKEKERNTEILRQMDPGEQERIIREVLKEFLS